MSHGRRPDTLLGQVSRSMFWNAVLLPLNTVVNLAAAVVLRRLMGFESGVYDILIGLINASLVYSSLGLTVTLPQYLPELRDAGAGAVRSFMRRVWSERLALLLLFLVPANLAALPIASAFDLGPEGSLLIHLASLLLLARAVVELSVKSLQALMAHLEANLLQMLQSLAGSLALIAALAAGLGMTGVFQFLAGAGVLVALAAVLVAGRAARRIGEPAAETRTARGDDEDRSVRRRGYWRFALFMYAYDLMYTFSMPAFASPALGLVADGRGPVALFNVAFQIPMMIVVVILSGFQGLYRPLFATLLAENDPDRLRTGFAEVSKVQAAMLFPAGAGLLVMIGDYVPLLFPGFGEAVLLARILCLFLFLETAFNLGIIILSADHAYRTVIGAQLLRVLAAPVFVWLAGQGRLVEATLVFGLGRSVTTLTAYVAARSRYGLRFPWAFCARLLAPTGIMALTVAVARSYWETSWPEALSLTGVGALVFLLLARQGRILGPRELDLLRRARFPGSAALARWLAPPSR